jgi:hypothetical protein
MTTNVSIIQSAYQIIGVVAESQSVSAEQGQIGLDTLNQLMASLSTEDIDIGYFTQDSTTDDCPIPEWAERGIISKLAQELLAIYPSAQVIPRITDDETNGYAVIRRMCMNQKLQGQDTSYLGLGGGNYWWARKGYSINDG